MITFLFRLLPVALVVFVLFHGSDKVQEIVERVKDVFLEVKTSLELSGIARNLRPRIIIGDAPPYDFRKYLRDNMKSIDSDPSLDPWESPYQLVYDDERNLWVISCGPDGTCDTEDDLRALVYTPKAAD